MIRAAALLLAGLSLSATQSSDRAARCCEPAAADFPSVGGNLGNQSYSSLAQITRDGAGAGRGRAGEFFYHDCANPQTTGKIVVR